MKQVKLNTLGDNALFQFSKYSKIIWQIQTPGTKVVASTTVSGITRTFKGSKQVWCKS